MILEADYGLGRNPLNMVQMTGLGSRHVEDIYTTGRNDGIPGVHPGHTPYMNADAVGQGLHGRPAVVRQQGLPGLEEVAARRSPLARAATATPTTSSRPQQTMRGKMCLLGYLYSLGDRHK